MSLLAAVSAALLLAVSGVNACSVPPGGCTPGVCSRLRRVTYKDSTNPLYGFYFGVWNKLLDPKLESAYGGPVVNYEAYQEIGYDGSYIATTNDTNLADCCTSCSLTYGCTMYQYFDSPTVGKKKRAIKGFKVGTQCYLLAGGSDYSKNKMTGTPFSGTHKQQVGAFKKIDASWVGGLCNLCYSN